MEPQENQLYMRFDQYVSNQLSKEEQVALEAELENSEEMKQEFMDFLASKKIAFHGSLQKEKNSLHEISTAYHQQKSQLKRRNLFMGALVAVAAAVLLLFIFFPVQQTQTTDPAQIYAANFAPQDAQRYLGQAEDSLLQRANNAFSDGEDYQQALALYQAIPLDSLTAYQQSQVHLYQGICYLTMGEGANARKQFASATQLEEDADWYTALSWLKEADQLDQAILAFEKIANTKGAFYQKKAKAILEALQKQ